MSRGSKDTFPLQATGSVEGWRKTVQNTLPYLFHPTTYSKYFHPMSYAAVDFCSPIILDRASIESRFQENGSIEYYGRERELDIEPPNCPETHSEMAKRVGTCSISKPFVGSLRDVHLIGDVPIPVDRRGNVALEAVVSPEVMALNIAHSVKGLLSKPLKKPGTETRPSTESIESAALLYNCWNSGYFHWTVETLARLEGLEVYRERTGTRPKLIIGPDPSQFQLQSLKLLGYEEKDLIRWKWRHKTVDELVIPSIRRELNPGEASPVAHWWLRERMRNAAAETAPDAASKGSRRVYISREDADYRCVVNEDEVLERLEPYGFEKYVLSEREMAEDVALFSKADVIVAPHGAGLTNVLYSRDATVIELFRKNHVQPVYFLLSKQLGHRYHYLLCDYEGTDIVVDTAQLESIVCQEIAHSGNDTENNGADSEDEVAVREAHK